jgi:phage terminase small subunit
MPKTSDLTLKQQLFVNAYLGEARGNGVQAARLAGYKGTDVTLRAVASENLTKPAIAARIEQRIEQAAMSADEVLRELTAIARSDSRDKIRALELLGKHHRLFVDRFEARISEAELDAEFDALLASLLGSAKEEARRD